MVWHDSQLFEDIEKCHVEHFAADLLEGLNVKIFQPFKWREFVLDIFRRKESFKELFYVVWTELLIKPELGQVHILLKLDSPPEKAILVFFSLEMREPVC